MAESTAPFTKDDESTTKRKIRKYLIFKLVDAVYGVPLSEVKEVIGLPPCIPVPGAPAYFIGLINLRGKVISAIDLKKKLSMNTKAEAVKRSAVIITETSNITIGCIVDAVSEVLSIDEDQIERTIEIDVQGQHDFVEGIARFPERPMIILLDLKKAADVSELIRIKELAAN